MSVCYTAQHLQNMHPPPMRIDHLSKVSACSTAAMYVSQVSCNECLSVKVHPPSPSAFMPPLFPPSCLQYTSLACMWHCTVLYPAVLKQAPILWLPVKVVEGEKVTLVGNSLGGYTSLLTAVNFPEVVKAVVLLNAGTHMHPHPG